MWQSSYYYKYFDVNDSTSVKVENIFFSFENTSKAAQCTLQTTTLHLFFAPSAWKGANVARPNWQNPREEKQKEPQNCMSNK